MIEHLERILPKNRIRSRLVDVLTFASDAGFYELIPKAVVQPVNEQEIIKLMNYCRGSKIPLVFRTGGTSLSGQSITDGILVDLSQHWNKVFIEGGGEVVRTQPGITGAAVNAYLKIKGRKIGPDPSSISAAMMGGILSNNASGMCCGVKMNSYHTLKYIRFILPDGKRFSTEHSNDYLRFEQECPDLFKTLEEIRGEIAQDVVLYKKIRSKYRTKTTIGYSLNAFIDFEHPLDIFAHLLIGAEGTLGFIAEAVLHTVPDFKYKSTGLLYFPTIFDACEAIVPLTNSGAMMVELMDRASLRAIENVKGIPPFVRSLPDTAAALLIEFQENEEALLDERVAQFLTVCSTLTLLNAPDFTTDTYQQQLLWKIRKGLFPAVGAVRASGTTVILEDIAFPVEQLGHAILDLQELFRKYHYDNAIIFGHAKDGNIHFVVTQALDTPAEISRYSNFMKEVVSLVVQRYNGTLKAEHGTGRNMAPFVETEWGGKAYEIMKRIKATVDPDYYLNPGVIINEDPDAYIKNLKQLPAVEEEVDRCIECGYCEHRCPSRNITTTPRRRIVARRALKKLSLAGDTVNYNLLLQQYQYDGIETCAVDGLCAPACPVDINTGDLIKRLRRENHVEKDNRYALWVAKNFSKAQWMIRQSLSSGVLLNKLLGKNTMPALTRVLQRVLRSVPAWTDTITAPPDLSSLKRLNVAKSNSDAATIVYFPSCISRIMGTYPGKGKNIMQTFISVCTKTGFAVKTLSDINRRCCGQVFSSKGYEAAFRHTASAIVQELWVATDHGRHPIVIDVSSCAYTLQNLRSVLKHEDQKIIDQLQILDSVDFLHDMVLPRCQTVVKKSSIALHPVCSHQKTNTTYKLAAIGKRFADDVLMPSTAGCCGMAGDRGFLFPELTASATKEESAEIGAKRYEGYYSSTKTCEMAMTQAVQQQFESILYLVDEGIQ